MAMNVNTIKAIVKKPLYKLYESRILKFLDRDLLPQHIGVILDGHRRSETPLCEPTTTSEESGAKATADTGGSAACAIARAPRAMR